MVAEIFQVKREQAAREADLERLRMEILSATSEFDIETDQLIADLARGWKLKELELAKLESKLEASV